MSVYGNLTTDMVNEPGRHHKRRVETLDTNLNETKAVVLVYKPDAFQS